jgi:biotin synthase
MTLAEKLIRDHILTKEEFVNLLSDSSDAQREQIRQEAVRLREMYYGHDVYTRGLIEFTNYCKNNCYYCGIRHDNHTVERYRLTKEEILACCESGYALGFRTFVLQGGEDPWYNDDRMVDIVKSIREGYPDCAITLSLGERSFESYQRLKAAGADRYLLRHETANEAHYSKLHPEEMSLANRKACLYQLKSLGYQVGAGFMVGSPGQTLSCLADDLLFLHELQPAMIGIGPFLPHHETPFANEEKGSYEQTLFLLSVLRVMFPKVLLPATTALGTIIRWDVKPVFRLVRML